MPKKKPSEKNKAWEKDRRDRLNKSFEQLAKLLPQYDPSVNWSKIEIIQKSIEHIELLHKNHEDFLKSQNPETLKQYDEFIETLKYLQSRNGQLAELLVKAKISLPASKPPAFLKENLKLCENNNLGDINIKPVGRPGKYVNKIDKDDLDGGKEDWTELLDINTNVNKNGAPTEKEQNEVSDKQNGNISAVSTAVTVTSTFNAETSALRTTGILVPVIPIQPQPALNQAVVSSQLIPPVIPTISTMSPLINVTNLTPTQIVMKNTTMTHVFNYAKEKNGKIKILPRPQVKLYFRRPDGKIPIPVIKKRITAVKRKRKRKRRSTPNNKGIKKRKIEKNEEIKTNKLSNKDRESSESKTDQNLKVVPTDEKVNKENVPVSSNEVQSGYLPELDISQNETNPNSVSPTAAFLMSFPVVNTSSGKFPGMVDDSEMLTPNLERKDSTVDNLENLNNFFTTKEYTKYCGENSERHDSSKKNGKSITIIEDLKIPPASYNPSTFFNPFTVSNTFSVPNKSTFDKISIAPSATIKTTCTFNSLTSHTQLGPTYKQSLGDTVFKSSSFQGNNSKTSNLFSYSNNCDRYPTYLNQSITSCAAAVPKQFIKEENNNPSTPSMTSISSSKQNNLPLETGTSASQNLASSNKDLCFGAIPTAVLASSATTTFVTSLSSTTTPMSLPIFTNSLLSTCTTLSVSGRQDQQAQNNYPGACNSSVSNTNMYLNQAVSTTSVLNSPVVWPNSITSRVVDSKIPTSVGYTPAFTAIKSSGLSNVSTQSISQHLASTAGNTFNSFSTNLAPKCTPLPLEAPQKLLNNSSQSLINISITKNTTSSTTRPKFEPNWNNISTSANSIQRPPGLPFSICSSIPSTTSAMLSSTYSFPPPVPCNFNVSQSCPILTKEKNPQALKSFKNYGTTHTPAVNIQKTETGTCPNSSLTVSTSSVPTSYVKKTQSIKTTCTNFEPIYSESVTQGRHNTNVTSTQNYVSSSNYYYPQTTSNFTLNFTTASSISSQVAPPQNVLPYPLKPDMSWMPPITTDYKPSFTFSLTSTSTSSCKQSTLNSFMTSTAKQTNLNNFPPIFNESKNNTKTVFSPYDTSSNHKNHATSSLKEPVITFPSTNFTFSLTNPKSSIITTAESKVPFTTNPSRPSQQLNNFDNKFQSTQHMPNFTPQIKNAQNEPCFTFALTNTSKTMSVSQKSRNPFTIDATLGIGNNSTCFMDGSKKAANPISCSRDEHKIQSTQNKPHNKTVESNNVSIQPNSFYECNQKTEKFGQKGHVNWMTSSEMNSNSAEYGQSSYRTTTEPYHPYGVCEENFPSWSPSKMYDTSHLIVPPTTVPSYYSDMNFNTPTYNVAPALLDTPKIEKNYKPPINNGNQANFFSVSHLVDQGNTSKQYNRVHKKVSPTKLKDGHKQEELKTPYNTPQAIFSETFACSGPLKPTLSNNYSAEALISKKEKHRNFSGMSSSEFYNPMDISGTYHPDSAEQNYNSNYFYNYPTNQNYGQDNDYLGAYTSENQFGKTLHKYNKKLAPTAPPPPPPNLISYDSNYFPAVPLAASSPLNTHPPLDGFESHHYNHPGNFQANTWGSKASGHSEYQNQNQHFPSAAEIGQINSHHVQNTAQPVASGNLTNFNLSTICPEINDKGTAPNVW